MDEFYTQESDQATDLTSKTLSHKRKEPSPSFRLQENNTHSPKNNMDSGISKASVDGSIADKMFPKMSGAADSHVRLQCNLKYNIKPLNACAIHKKNKPFPSRNKNQDSSSNRTTLPLNHLLNLGQLEQVYDFQALVYEIKIFKQGTKCKALDVQHIWERFRRYNLKRDKQILPVAALKAFIEGWLVDEQVSFVKQNKTNATTPSKLENEEDKIKLRDTITKLKAQKLKEEQLKTLRLREERDLENAQKLKGLQGFEALSTKKRHTFLKILESHSALLSLEFIRARWKEINYNTALLNPGDKTDSLILREIGLKFTNTDFSLC